ncbi:MAG: hypothetical protein FWG10_06955 [Eubacteriaceae bacterium]|nr:hypothetical protein [Eubacteriaceae bacterium]
MGRFIDTLKAAGSLGEGRQTIAQGYGALKSAVHSRHVRPNNELANVMTKDFLDEGEQSLVISTAKARWEIITKAMLE